MLREDSIKVVLIGIFYIDEEYIRLEYEAKC
jgi:hypothetical protein